MKKSSLIAAITIILCSLFLSGCGSTAENTLPEGGGDHINNNSSSVNVSENEPMYDTPANTQPVSAQTGGSNSEPDSPKQDQTVIDTTTESQTDAAPSESTSKDESLSADADPSSAPPTESTPAEETGDNSPQWLETELSCELYVNTDGIYSRASAIQGSETAAQYTLNDKVTVIAITDTDYYKLTDGTFIHADFLSENETAPVAENGSGDNSVAVSATGYLIETINGITYVDGIMIANKTYSLPESYDPGITKEAADALEEMQAAASAEGLTLYVVSGYRSYQTQEAVYAGWVDLDGRERADTYSSRAGHSDHQTGYTFDLNSLEQSFANTSEGIWLAEHCAEFGFIIRYPEGKEMYTGYIFEPWHVRYIGKEKARIITESGLSLEEYYGITSSYDDHAEE